MARLKSCPDTKRQALLAQPALIQPMKAAPLKKWLAFAALGVVWGSAWGAADNLAEYVPPLRGAAARFLLAALLWIPVILWKRIKLPHGRALGFVLLLSVTMIVLPFVLILWAQRHASSVTITVLFAAMPLLVGLLTLDDVPWGAMQATVIGLGGIVLAMGASFSVSQAGGAAVALLAVAITGASAVLARRELRAVNPLAVTALLSGTAALLLFLASMALERGQSAQWNRSAVGSLLFLGFVAGAPAYALYFWLLQQLEAYKVTTVQWIEPLIALVETALFLRFGLSFSMVAGAVVTLTSLLLVMRARAEDDKNVSLLGN
jgi:drug/metabolite transporter (DMT)-like permease